MNTRIWDGDESIWDGIDWDAVRQSLTALIPPTSRKVLGDIIKLWPTAAQAKPTAHQLQNLVLNPQLISTDPQYHGFAQALPAAVSAENPTALFGAQLADAFVQTPEIPTVTTFDATKDFHILEHHRGAYPKKYDWNTSYFILEQDGKLLKIGGFDFAKSNASLMTRAALAGLMEISCPSLKSKFRDAGMAGFKISMKEVYSRPQKTPSPPPEGFNSKADFKVCANQTEFTTSRGRKVFDWDKSFIVLQQKKLLFQINAFDFVAMRAPHVSRAGLGKVLGLRPAIVVHKLETEGLGHLQPSPGYYKRLERQRNPSQYKEQNRNKDDPAKIDEAALLASLPRIKKNTGLKKLFRQAGVKTFGDLLRNPWTIALNIDRRDMWDYLNKRGDLQKKNHSGLVRAANVAAALWRVNRPCPLFH